MKKIILFLAVSLLLMIDAKAFDVKLLANNKEAFSREFMKGDLGNMQYWKNQHALSDEEMRSRAIVSLSETMNEIEKDGTNCELGLVHRLLSNAQKHELIVSNDDAIELVTFLRDEDLIDDIFYRILKKSIYLDNELGENLTSKSESITNVNTDQELERKYAPFKTWPDEIKTCSIDAFYSLTNDLTYKNSKDRNYQLQTLNWRAYQSGVIGRESFQKLEVLRLEGALNWDIYLKRYMDIIKNAKDKLTKTPELLSHHKFSETYISRKEKITRRSRLYITYTSTQVMVLAQLIERTAKRMDAKKVALNFQYTDDPNGESEVYIFSPMEQYRAAVKLLRKDMAEIMRSEAFQGTGLVYEDLIAAAFETGFIKSEELDHVLKFEEFWNPKNPKWKVYANFAMSIAGTAVFYLPPPWNIVGAIGLVLSQAQMNRKKDDKNDPDDNWNVII